MALLNILQYPDPRLKTKALPVDTFDQEITTLVNNMLETMYEAQGVGLAATQVNVHKRVLVMDVTEERVHPICIINPEIIAKRGEIEWKEGCLSFPGVFATVKRAREIDLRYYDREGRMKDLTADGLLSVCIQHEIDHLEGITFFDYLSPLKQTMLKKKLDKYHRRAL